MYYIKKYADGWALHDDATGLSRLLLPVEVEAVKREFPQLTDPKVRTVFTDVVRSGSTSQQPGQTLESRGRFPLRDPCVRE